MAGGDFVERPAVSKQLLALAQLRYKERKTSGWTRSFTTVLRWPERRQGVRDSARTVQKDALVRGENQRKRRSPWKLAGPG